MRITLDTDTMEYVLPDKSRVYGFFFAWQKLGKPKDLEVHIEGELPEFKEEEVEVVEAGLLNPEIIRSVQKIKKENSGTPVRKTTKYKLIKGTQMTIDDILEKLK